MSKRGIKSEYTISEMRAMSWNQRDKVFQANKTAHKLKLHTLQEFLDMSIPQIESLVSEIADENTIKVSTKGDFFEVLCRHKFLKEKREQV